MRNQIFRIAIPFLSVLAGCAKLDEDNIEALLEEKHTYPKTVETILYCNDSHEVVRVIDAGLVRDGLVTAQLEHTSSDIGKPLIYFTDKAAPYLLPTSDTLKSFDKQKLKVAAEYFLRVVSIQISESGKEAVVDYATEIKEPTPFAVLYRQDINGEQPRRIFLTRNGDQWQWDGRIVKGSPKRR